MAGPAPDPFGGAETPRESPRCGEDRLLAAGRSRDRRERREAETAERPGRRSALRAYHLACNRGWGCKRNRRSDSYFAEPAPEMRALLALARGRGRRPGPPRDLRALRAKPLRFRRAPAIRMIPASLKRIAPWLALAALLALADQASKDAISSSLRYGEGRGIAPFFNLRPAPNRGAAFSFLAHAGGWQRALFIAVAVAAPPAILLLLVRHSIQRLFS